MRRAFGIVQALMLLLLVAGMMMVVMRYARIGVHHTQDTYVKEQAQLLLDSAVEWAIFQMAKQGGKCWEGGAPEWSGSTVRGYRYDLYVTVERYYLHEGSCSHVDVVPIQSERSQYYALLRVEANATLDNDQTVRLIRRTLQRL